MNRAGVGRGADQSAETLLQFDRRLRHLIVHERIVTRETIAVTFLAVSEDRYGGYDASETTRRTAMSYPVKITVGLLGLVLVMAFALLSGSGREDKFSPNPLTPLQAKSQQLDVAIAESIRRLEAGNALITMLIEGRASLAEVARDFLSLHENDPEFLEYYQLYHSGRTLPERVARDMANRAHLEAADPLQRERVAKRLTEEFQTLFPEVEPLRFQPVPVPAPKPALQPMPPGHRPLPVPVPVPLPVVMTE
jgi:hypothetical protein